MLTHFLYHGYDIAGALRRGAGRAAVHADLERWSATCSAPLSAARRRIAAR